MKSIITVELTRDCDAIQIPVGERVTLPAGTSVDITQSLGGTFTVRVPGGLFRIAAADCDALGMAPEENGSAPVPKTGHVGEEDVWAVLKTCFDPEIPVNIVDLGLVYDMSVEPLNGGGNKVQVKMTLTAPGCGMGTVIAGDAQGKLLQIPGVVDASVDIVWDPPWHQSMITAEGRKILGLE